MAMIMKMTLLLANNRYRRKKPKDLEMFLGFFLLRNEDYLYILKNPINNLGFIQVF